MRPIGPALVVFFVTLPLVFLVPMTGQHDPVALFSQYLGAAALVAMGITQLLATRWRGLVVLFGGIGKVFFMHKWLAIGALCAAFLHSNIDAESDQGDTETLLNEIAESLGEISLYGLMALAAIMLLTFIPRRFRRWTHQFTGTLFAFAAFHFVFIAKPFSINDPLGVYILSFCILGIAVYLYALRPHLKELGQRRFSSGAPN